MYRSKLAIGIEIGASATRTGLVFQKHVIEFAPPLVTSEFSEPAALIEALIQGVDELRASHPEVAALGVGLPGMVDFDKGWVHSLTNVSGWESMPLARMIEDKTNLPTVIDNRVNCMAMAEWKCGVARGLRDVVFVNLESGVGGAIIASNRMIRGSCCVAGEIGQTTIDWRGREGEFGNPGAIEKYLGSAEIAADTCEAYAAANIQKDIKDCSIPALISAAYQQDPVALTRCREIAGMLAATISNSCWLLNPGAVIVGGGITRAGDLFFDPLREELFKRLSYPFKDHLMILPPSLGPDAATIGAAALALETAHIRG